MVTQLTPNPAETRRGVIAALAAYGLWGLTPLFWPLVGAAGAVEVLAHRFVWSTVLVLLLALVLRVRWWTVFRNPAVAAQLFLCGILVGGNWGVFIWAVNNHRALDGALGYYINPLLSIVAGVVLLRERLTPIRWVAVGIAALGVVWMTVELGQLPWVALVLASSFALYGVIKKRLNVEAITTMTIETLLLVPIALGYLIFLGVTAAGSFGQRGLAFDVLLICSGAVSLVPLTLFAVAAPKIPLSLMGMLQYIAPTMQFLLSIYVLGESMSTGRWIGFFAVWVALVLISFDGLFGRWRQARMARRAG